MPRPRAEWTRCRRIHCGHDTEMRGASPTARSDSRKPQASARISSVAIAHGYHNGAQGRRVNGGARLRSRAASQARLAAAHPDASTPAAVPGAAGLMSPSDVSINEARGSHIPGYVFIPIRTPKMYGRVLF